MENFYMKMIAILRSFRKCILKFDWISLNFFSLIFTYGNKLNLSIVLLPFWLMSIHHAEGAKISAGEMVTNCTTSIIGDRRAFNWEFRIRKIQ